MLFQSGERDYKSRRHTDVDASQHLNLECRLAVSNHTLALQYDSSAWSVRKVEVKAEMAYFGRGGGLRSS